MENEKFKFWWLLLLKGLVGIIFGLYIIISADKIGGEPSLSLLVNALGGFLLVTGLLLGIAALTSPPDNPLFGMWLAQGIFNTLFGIIILWNRGLSEITIAYIIVGWFFVSGALNIVSGLVSKKKTGNWLVTFSGGVVSIFLGVLIVSNVEGQGVRTLLTLLSTGAIAIT